LRYPVAVAVIAAPLISLFWGCADIGHPGMARGHELYDTCIPCHGKHGAGNATLGAPAIAGLPRWYIEAQLQKFRDGQRGTHPDDMEGHRMRPMARSLNLAGDVASVAQYVASMPAQYVPMTIAGGDTAAGSQRYSTMCVVCHGPDAKGMEAMVAPPLLDQPDWYLIRQLDKYKSHMRGFDSTDMQGQQMAAMSTSLEDHKAMLDVIAYIKTLKK
jgi:cytochrome c oxidase subunit II